MVYVCVRMVGVRMALTAIIGAIKNSDPNKPLLILSDYMGAERRSISISKI